MKKKSVRMVLIALITTLFIVSAVTPIAFGFNSIIIDKDMNEEPRDYYHFNCYHQSEIHGYKIETFATLKETVKNSSVKEEKRGDSPISTAYGPMDSPWPMYCHDVRHTGRSPYSTVDTWDEIWRFHTVGSASSPVIDDDGVIYVGSHDLQAVYPNGTLKWSCDVSGWIESCPAIDENGTLYVGTVYGYLYALYPNGTLKWIYGTEGDILSSPAIGDDGTIYFGNEVGYPLGGYINALYPNGTVKWRFKTGHVVYSSPAIGSDGNVYCGSHDTYLYALYPNNGTVKWKYKTGHWVRVSPCIADDGTIYVVSLDNHLHAVYPNGTLKWKTNMGQAGTSPTIGQDGTIYCGYTRLHTINPNNGSVKWTFDVGGTMRGGNPCNSIDGTIYVGTSDGGEIIAVNPSGTLKWRRHIGECESAPAIGEDGTVYIGSNAGYLYAFGIGELQADADGPYYGLVDESVQFEGSSKGGYSPHTYFWDFGDGHTSEEQNPTHSYTEAGNYTVTLTVTDNTSNTSSDTSWAWIQESNDPPDKPSIDGETNGKKGISYDYTFVTDDPEGLHIWYYIEWGDGTNTGWFGPYSSGKEITKSHTWNEKGNYTIRCKAKDPYNDEGPWGYLEVEMPVNLQGSQMQSSRQSKSLVLFQILEKIMNRLPFSC